MAEEIRRRFAVTRQDTAEILGSGSLPVLGTPRLLAWMESVTVLAADQSLHPGETTVGTRVVLEHLASSGVESCVEVRASLVHRDGRLLRFSVAAYQVADQLTEERLLGTAEITRVVVNEERFMARIQ